MGFRTRSAEQSSGALRPGASLLDVEHHRVDLGEVRLVGLHAVTVDEPLRLNYRALVADTSRMVISARILALGLSATLLGCAAMTLLLAAAR
jgi:hypothetical protein